MLSLLQCQANMRQCLLGRAAHGHLVHQHSELAFEVDAVGLAAPVGNTVRYPGTNGVMTVTFSATAAASAGTSVNGTPAT